MTQESDSRPSPTEPTHPPVRKREIFGWAMFDFANSSYTTVVITVVYGAFFTKTIVPSGGRYSYWSASIIAATLIALMLCPFVGAICDRAGRKKVFLAIAAGVCALSTAALGFVGPGDVWLGLTIVAISNAAFMIGECFCASFLTDLATRDNMARISGIGWALGYFGGLASLILVQGIITANPDEAPDRYITQNQLAMVATGVFFLVTAIPTFLLVRERSRPSPGFERASIGQLFRFGLEELKSSWQLVRAYPILFQFLVAFLVYMAGLYTIISFVGIYAEGELGLTLGQRTVMFLVVQVSAAAGAIGFGFVERRTGPKNTVLLTLAWWCAGVLATYFLDDIASIFGVEPSTVFIALSLVIGSAMGATQSSSRALVGLLTPESRSAQMFGFWGSFARLSALLAMSYGFLADAVGLRSALLIVLAFFGIGALMLARIPIDRGIREAREADGA